MYITQLRIKDETANKLKKIAEEKERSFNQQVEYIVKKYIEDYERINGEIKIKEDA